MHALKLFFLNQNYIHKPLCVFLVYKSYFKIIRPVSEPYLPCTFIS